MCASHVGWAARLTAIAREINPDRAVDIRTKQEHKPAIGTYPQADAFARDDPDRKRFRRMTMVGVVSFLLFAAALLVGLGVIVFTLVERWDAILAALAGAPIPERKPVVYRRVARMRSVRRTYRPEPSPQQILRAAA
jgi:hypothetical protein